MLLQTFLKYNTGLFKSKTKPNLHIKQQKNNLTQSQNQHQNFNNVHLTNNWKKLLQKCSTQYSSTIISILSEKNTTKQFNQKLSSILNFNVYKKVPTYQLALITIGMSNSKENLSIRQLKSRALDMFIHNSDTITISSHGKNNEKISNSYMFREQKITSLEHEQIEFFVSELSQTIMETIQTEQKKHSKLKYKIKLLSLLDQFSNELKTIQTLKKLTNIVLKLTIDNNIVNKSRLSKTIEMLNNKIYKCIIDNPQLVTNVSLYQDGTSKLSFEFFINLFKCINFCQLESLQAEKYYFNIILSDQFLKPDITIYQQTKFYMKLYSECHSYFNENGINPISQKIRYLFENNNESKKSIKEMQYYHQINLLENMIKNKLFVQYLKMQSIIIDGHVTIQKLPPKPKLNSFQATLLKMNLQKIASNGSIFSGLMRAFYPQNFKNLNAVIPNIKKQNFHTDNEHAARLQLALEELGIPFTKQQRLHHKRVDFLLNNQIVLQCDGDAHIDYKRYDVSQSTAFRNMLMLYGGYKMIVIQIQQLNAHRSVEGLKKLIQTKLEIMNNNNAIFVQ